jgi:hypothetical protein
MVEFLTLSEDLFSQCKAVGVVVHEHRKTEFSLKNLLERNFIPSRNVLYIVDNSLFPVHDARNADADRCSLLIYETGDQVLQ